MELPIYIFDTVMDRIKLAICILAIIMVGTAIAIYVGEVDYAEKTAFVRPNPPAELRNQIACLDSYPDFCIIPGTPDRDCADLALNDKFTGISYSNFQVIGSDPHGFDDDGDGIGCES